MKSDRAGIIVSNKGFSNYSVKRFGSTLVTKRNRASVKKIDPKSVPGYQCGNDSLLSVQVPVPEQLSQAPLARESIGGRQGVTQDLGGTGGGGCED